MILYHGSNLHFEKIDLSKSKDKRDFGRGFYTTAIREQAEDQGKVLCDRYKGEGIFIYEVEYTFSDKLSVKTFEGLSEEWLLMVQQNRTLGGVQHQFDIVKGPVADNKTARTIALYIAGIIHTDEAIKRLSFNQVSNQVSFHTDAALSQLIILRKYQL